MNQTVVSSRHTKMTSEFNSLNSPLKTVSINSSTAAHHFPAHSSSRPTVYKIPTPTLNQLHGDKIIQISPSSARTLLELFSQRLDAQGRNITIQQEEDWKLTLPLVKRQIFESHQILNKGVTNQECVRVENRLPWLLKYEKMLSNPNQWSEIEFLKQKHSKIGIGMSAVEHRIHSHRVEDELLSFQQRQEYVLDKQILKQISRIDPKELGSRLIKDQQRHKSLEDELDDNSYWEVEQKKLTEEIRRWKIRSLLNYSGDSNYSPSTNSKSSAIYNEEFELLLQQQWENMELEQVLQDEQFKDDEEIDVVQLQHGSFFASQKGGFFLTEEELKSPQGTVPLSQFSEPIDHRQELQIKHLLRDLKRQASYQLDSARKCSPEFVGGVDVPTPVRCLTPIVKKRNEVETFSVSDSPTIKFKLDNGTEESAQLVVELHELIGSGGFSKVYQGTIVQSQERVAVKKIKAKSSSVKKVVKLEIAILKQLHHPNVVHYKGFGYNSSEKEYSLILEYCDGGTLEQTISKEGPLKEDKAAFILYQILNGLSYLKENQIIHRDIKPANILKKLNGDVYLITDFGISINLLTMAVSNESMQGTPHYAAPEVISIKPYGFAADVWSLGSTLFEMITGKRPYDECNAFTAMYKIVQLGHPEIPNHLSPQCKDFLEKCWTYDDTERPTIEELIIHPFLEKRH